MMVLPEGAAFVLKRLHERGFEAYVVGGCVRDSLLGRPVHDWDVCTSALPDEMHRAFSDCRVIDTGLQHGTLTVLRDHVGYEVTTFRRDGAYTDHRHPDQVAFVSEVMEDLQRRDFTINAMAWSPRTGLVDGFGGQEDLKAGVIRCVGDPARRFDEDALRILRALRFASVYGFRIEAETAAMIHRLKGTLKNVSAERVRDELLKLLCGRGVEEILRAYSDVFFTLLPQLAPMYGFDQHTPYHAFDVWEHTIRAVSSIRPVKELRLTMLLHDSGKPRAFTLDDRGIGHAWGHAKISYELALDALNRLKVDNATRDLVSTLVLHHGDKLTPSRPAVLRLLNRLGKERVALLQEVHRADEIAKGMREEKQIDAEMSRFSTILAETLATNPCYTLRDLALRGDDLLAAGIPRGATVGETLQYLLDRVMAGALPNTREALLAAALRRHRAAEQARRANE